MDGPDLVVLAPGVVLVRGAALLRVARIAAQGARSTNKLDGIALDSATRSDLAVLVTEARHVMSDVGRSDVREVVDESESDRADDMDAGQAAEVLGVSRRQVVRIAADLGGRRGPGRVHVFDRAAVVAYAMERNQDRSA